MLDLYTQGRVALAPPTIRILWDLSTLSDDPAHLIKQLGAQPYEPMCPQLHSKDKEVILSLPGDPLHTPSDSLSYTQHRFIKTKDHRWSLCLET